jgi:hypothetical protein
MSLSAAPIRIVLTNVWLDSHDRSIVFFGRHNGLAKSLRI